MSTKHFSDDATALVAAGLRAATFTNPSLHLDAAHKTVTLRDAASQPAVALLSGGGSGHEPSFAGLVGVGLLTAAVAGSVFASPSAEQVFRALRRVGAEQPRRGILVVVMNYTGDVLHFGMAVERARAEGIRVEMLVTGDDVGVGRERGGRIGRRGLAGTVLIQKIAAAAAAGGASLEDVHRIAALAAANTATVGASLAHVHVPGRRPAADELDGTTEIGMGIHNEEGFGRVRADLPGLVGSMLRQLLDPSDADRAFVDINKGDGVIVLVNNLGGISALELGAITAEVVEQLDASYGLRPARLLTGTYMSSLNMLGFSVTVLKVVDEAFLSLIDAPADAAGWTPPVKAVNWERGIDTSHLDSNDVEHMENAGEEVAPSNLRLDASTTTKALKAALSSLINAEPQITEYDTIVGDGDCGLCLKTGAEAVQAYLNSASPPSDAVRLVRDIARVAEQSMDGTSGALYAIFINALASGLQAGAAPTLQPTTPQVWASALKAALATLGKYTPARPGDRTVVDALAPFVDVLGETGDVMQAVEAARRGCEATKGMEASLGRSVYVSVEGWNACPDPGAYGLVKLLEGFTG